MIANNVVAFPARRSQHGWCQTELRDLIALHTALARSGRVSSWDVGVTETGDPQFYLAGGTTDDECILCLTRLDGRYVLEDGSGALVAESVRLQPIIRTASRMIATRRCPSLIVRTLFLICTCRALLDQKIELLTAESMEHLARFAPQLAALV